MNGVIVKIVHTGGREPTLEEWYRLQKAQKGKDPPSHHANDRASQAKPKGPRGQAQVISARQQQSVSNRQSAVPAEGVGERGNWGLTHYKSFTTANSRQQQAAGLSKGVGG